MIDERMPTSASHEPRESALKERAETQENSLDFSDVVQDLTEEQKDRMYEIMTNRGENETAVNYAVRFYTGQKDLEDYQRVLLAPANGIENGGRFIASLFTTSGWQAIGEGAQFVFDERFSATVRAAFEVFYNRLSLPQKTAFVTEYMSNAVLFNAMISRFANILTRILRARTVLAPGVMMEMPKAAVSVVDRVLDSFAMKAADASQNAEEYKPKQ